MARKKDDTGKYLAWAGLGLTALATIYTVASYYKDACPECKRKMKKIDANTMHCEYCQKDYYRQ